MNTEKFIESTVKLESISILRVLGMFAIVGCHLASFLNISFLSQFLNFGVYLFLFISGYLYANKEIINYKQWYISRIKKLLIPFYIFSIPVIILYYCNNSIDILEILKYIFCLQGINFICNFIPFSEITPLGNLWFITIIMICYLLMIIVKKIEKIISTNKCVISITLLFAFVFPKMLSLFGLPYIQIDYFIIYFAGYYISKFKVNVNKQIFIVFGIALFAFAVIFRLLGKHYLDDGYQNIYQIVVSITHPLTAISCYFIIDYLTKRINLLRLVARSKIWATLDKYSYFIYITHYAFLNSVTSVANFGFSQTISTLLFVVFTVVSSIILLNLSNIVQKLIK